MTLTYPGDAGPDGPPQASSGKYDSGAAPEGTTPLWNSCAPGASASGLAEDPVQVRATDRADTLGHLGALVVDANLAFSLALLLALHAVELAAPGLRHDGLLACIHLH